MGAAQLLRLAPRHVGRPRRRRAELDERLAQERAARGVGVRLVALAEGRAGAVVGGRAQLALAGGARAGEALAEGRDLAGLDLLLAKKRAAHRGRSRGGSSEPSGSRLGRVDALAAVGHRHAEARCREGVVVRRGRRASPPPEHELAHDAARDQQRAAERHEPERDVREVQPEDIRPVRSVHGSPLFPRGLRHGPAGEEMATPMPDSPASVGRPLRAEPARDRAAGEAPGRLGGRARVRESQTRT